MKRQDRKTSISAVTPDDESSIVEPIWLGELYETLVTCNDLAHGPDGFCYSNLKFLRPTFEALGTIVLIF